MVKDTGCWLVEIGLKNEVVTNFFNGTQKQLDEYIMKQYNKNKAEYVIVKLIAENIDFSDNL